jgi:hypothetical protein
VVPSEPNKPASLASLDASTCDEARSGMRAFVSGSIRPGPTPAWRKHMAACNRCTAEYQTLVQDVARIARGASDSTARATDAYVQERVRRTLIAADPGKRTRLPKLFLPVAIIGLLALVFTQSGTKHVMLHGLAGTVTKGSATVTEAVGASRGDGCSTGAGARAELVFGADRIVFGPESSFLVDRVDKLAVRFFAGEARVDGDASLLLPGGAVEVRAGVAVVTLQAGTTTIECDRGEVTHTDATGRHVVRAGETQRIEAPAPDPDR